LLICTAYEDDAGRRYHHVPRNDAVRKTLKPVYSKHPGWTEDVSKVRHFADLPKNAQLYVASMVKALLDVAYHGEPLPAAAKLPNLRYLGVGPEPSQIIKDVPATADLIRLV
jgi:adenylosuccinate synthase